MKSKKKKYNAIKSACKADREREIALYGKFLQGRTSQKRSTTERNSKTT